MSNLVRYISLAVSPSLINLIPSIVVSLHGLYHAVAAALISA